MRPIRYALLKFACFLVMLGMMNSAAYAHANCSISVSDINFGDISLADDVAFTSNGTITANCTSHPFQIITICAHIGSGVPSSVGSARRMASGINRLRYNLFQEVSHSTILGSYDWVGNPLRWEMTTNGLGSASGSKTIYANKPAGQTELPAGIYTADFSGTSVNIDFTDNSLACSYTWSNYDGQQYLSFDVYATNTSTCSVSATDLDFGSMGFLTSNVDASSSLSVTCTNGLAYNAGLNGGLSGATDPTQRKMSLGGEDVTYGLYRDTSRSAAWGDSIGSNTQSGTGTGTAQAYTVFGRVATQTTPSPGTYSDTIVVTITY